MPTSSTSGVIKKRKPPTFQHLPLDRAKKLKRSWVETQKIKSQWKAQKRKDGLITRKPVSEMVVEENFDEEDNEDGRDVDNKSRTSSQDESSSGEEAEEKGDKVESADESESESEEEAPNAVRTSRVGPSRGRGRGGRGQGRPTELPYKRRRDADEDKEEPTLRELNKLAYSRSSLHTYKSDPLHRHNKRHGERGGGRGRATGQRGRGRDGEGRGNGRGRGQPDMRLRMNAMLEKIKRDMS